MIIIIFISREYKFNVIRGRALRLRLPSKAFFFLIAEAMVGSWTLCLYRALICEYFCLLFINSVSLGVFFLGVFLRMFLLKLVLLIFDCFCL